MREVTLKFGRRRSSCIEFTRSCFEIFGKALIDTFRIIPVGGTFNYKILHWSDFQRLDHCKFIRLVIYKPFFGLIRLISIAMIRAEDRISVFIFISNSRGQRHYTSEIVPFIILRTGHRTPIRTIVIKSRTCGNPISQLITAIENKAITLIKRRNGKSF